MKKIISFAIALAMIASVGTTALADTAGTILEGENQIGYKGIEVDETDGTQTNVPVFGYIGPATDITDPNPGPGDEPGDPGDNVDPPVYNLVQVVVPVKLMWAAFDDNDNEVASPEYKIQNRSFKKIDVSLVSFTPRAGDASATGVADKLTLNISPIGNTVFQKSNVINTSAVTFGTALNEIGENGDTWNFEITGTYTGSYNAIKAPQYDMTLRFDIAN